MRDIKVYEHDKSIKKHETLINDISLNIKEFGAIGDGDSHPLSELFTTISEAQIKYPCATSLSDEIDQCAIQTTINKVALSGGTVFIPNGTYLISNLKVPLNVAIVGSIRNFCKLKSINNNTNNYLIELNGQRATLKEITLDGNRDNNKGTTIYGVYLSADATKIYDSDILYCSGSGIYGGSMDGIIKNVRSCDHNLCGIHITSTVKGGPRDGTDMHIQDCLIAGNLDGIVLESGNTILANCKSYLNKRDGYVLCNQIHMSNSESQENGRHGVYLKNASLCLISNLSIDGMGASYWGTEYQAESIGLIIENGYSNRIRGVITNNIFLNAYFKTGVKITGNSYFNDIDLDITEMNSYQFEGYQMSKPFVNEIKDETSCYNKIIINKMDLSNDLLLPSDIRLYTDSNKDGIPDDFESTNYISTSINIIDEKFKCYRLIISSVGQISGGGNSGIYKRVLLNGATLMSFTVDVNGRVTQLNNTKGCSFGIFLKWLNGKNEQIGWQQMVKEYKQYSNDLTGWSKLQIINITPPLGAVSVDVIIGGVLEDMNVNGEALFKGLYISKKIN